MGACQDLHINTFIPVILDPEVRGNRCVGAELHRVDKTDRCRWEAAAAAASENNKAFFLTDTDGILPVIPGCYYLLGESHSTPTVLHPIVNLTQRRRRRRKTSE